MDGAARQDLGTEGFPDFHERAHGQVYRALALTLRDPDLAAEATQEGLSRALARWDDVSEYGNPTGWVFRVGITWARSRPRRLLREIRRIRGVERLPPAEMPDPPDPAVASALAGLPIEQRAVAVLRLYLDWSVEDTAAALGVSRGTVRSRLHRALERVRERVEAMP